MIPYVLVLAGLILLYYGAEWLVDGGAKLALRLGVSPLFVAMTIMAYGTSAPELMIGIRAAIDGSGDIAVGNVVGSNIFNIAAALGIAALICPLPVGKKLYRFELPVTVLASLLVGFFLMRDDTIHITEGLIFLSIFAGCVAYSLINAKRGSGAAVDTPAEAAETADVRKNSVVKCVALIIVGLATVVGGADLLVRGAVALARSWGVTETLIALTIVAAGTSLPELVITAMAAFKKQHDIAVGNIVGSCIFNILCILGIVGVMKPVPANDITTLDVSLMIALAAALLFIPLLTKRTLTRWTGGMFLGIYVTYVVILCVKAM